MKKSLITVSILSVLAGCAATLPNGPSVAVMPAPGKAFEIFAAEDRECRQFSQRSIGTAADKAANDAQIKSIAAGTALGAIAGALGGGHSGAGSGAGFGMLAGAAIGSDEGNYSGREIQRRYDIAYEQCMYAKGNQLPQAYSYQPRVIYQVPPPAPLPSNSPPASYSPPYYPPPPPVQ